MFRIVDNFGLEMESGIATREEAEERLMTISLWAAGANDDPTDVAGMALAKILREEVFHIEEER